MNRRWRRQTNPQAHRSIDQPAGSGQPVFTSGPAPNTRAEKLVDHERRIYLPLVLSALLPIVVAASRSATDSCVSIAVNVVTWLVFVYDLFVHMR